MRVARLATERPWLVLGIWLGVIVLLSLRGIGVEDRLHRATIEVPGGALDANTLGTEHFGQFNSLTVLLEGPAEELDAQGPGVTRMIDALEATKVLSPWGATGGGERLRREDDKALIVVRVEAEFEHASKETVPALRSILKDEVAPPVEARVTGAADIANGIHGGSIEALSQAELIAAPILMIVLLFVFRSVVAAGVALGLGLMTIGAMRGAIDLINGLLPLDALALSTGSMIGLALGVDYSLLVISRFREELGARAVPDSVVTTARTAGRTVVFAGIAVLLTGLLSVMNAPGDLLASAGAGVVLAATMSVATAVWALPAVLTILGPRINRLSLPTPTEGKRGTAAIAIGALRRPAIAALAIAALLGALAAPVMALETGPPDPRQLSPSSEEHADYEAIKEALGPGWMAPYDIVVAVEEGTVTEAGRLEALDRFQDKIAADDDVAAVFGPGPLKRASDRVTELPARLAEGQEALDQGLSDQRRLQSGIERVGLGVDTLRDGLATAAEGASALAAGSTRADDGTTRLVTGLEQARAGADRLSDGLDRATAGANALEGGLDRALSGAERLAEGAGALRAGGMRAADGAQRLSEGLAEGADRLERLREPAQVAERELATALDALDAMLPTSKVDPQYLRLYRAVGTASAAITGRDPRDGSQVEPGYEGMDASLALAGERLRAGADASGRLVEGLNRMVAGLERLSDGASSLDAGLARLTAGAGRLTDGLERLSAGGAALGDGAARLATGADSLGDGIDRLDSGAGRLASGLASGVTRSAPLEDGIDRMSEGIAAGIVRTKRFASDLEGSERLGRAARSGHMLLATIDSAPENQRVAASFVVNVDRRGSAADITVVPNDPATEDGDPLRDRLENAAAELSDETGMETRVGGAAPIFQDFDAATSESLPFMIIGLLAATYLVLVPIFRSLLLPLIAVGLNALTVLAAFGALVLLFQGPTLLGGAGFLDAIITLGVVGVVFGLSIDYAVFLISRMREGYELTGDTDAAIEYGLRGTARIVTGAAAIMSAVFLALALSGMSTLRQFGVGLTIAILLDATVVRLVLLPALIKLAGSAAWWLPDWLERRLPDLNPDDPSPAKGVA